MSRQERTARRTKRAEGQLEDIIAEVVARVRCKECQAKGKKFATGEVMVKHKKTCSKVERLAPPTTPPAQAKGAPQTDATARKGLAGARAKVVPAQPTYDDQAAEVKRLRDDEGMSWVAIGAKLGLPGSKSGAATARALYKKHFGSYAHTHTTKREGPNRPRRERNVTQKETKTERVARVRGGGHVIPLDTPDAEVVELLRGKTVGWSIDIRKLAGGKGEPHYSEQEAQVHPQARYVRVEEGKDGERVVRFKEVEYSKEGPVSTATRVVRLASIHTVKG